MRINKENNKVYRTDKNNLRTNFKKIFNDIRVFDTLFLQNLD